ncbi:MAG: glycine betaine/L-proline ABC transporter ATP-binding protein [Lentisphaerae bacterium]|nr:glycine betaine/L-proline ABC transporter ATP-binding protein [Lentisphaerota bacterium]
MSKIVVKNLYKVFGSNPKQGIKLSKDGKEKDEILKLTGLTMGVNNVSFEIEDGETFVIMGQSGSGKSTVIRCLNRLIEPTSGEILLDGEDILKMNKKQLVNMRRTAMSMVFQNFALLPNRTVLSNAEYGLEVQGIDSKKRRENAMEALKLVGLEGYENSYPDQLSGGMKQRVGLARSLANDPEILLMDEAFSALDPLIRSDMQDELIDLQQKMKKTIVFITHDLDEALKLGDRIMLMKDGKLIQIGKPEEILSNPADDYVERFVRGVDRSGLLTASDIMVKPRTTVKISQGPRFALAECKKHGLEYLLVVKEGRILVGSVSLDDIKRSIEEGKSTIHDIVREDNINRVNADCNIKDIIEPTLQSSLPVSVVNDEGRLLGVIIKSNILSAMISERSNGDA